MTWWFNEYGQQANGNEGRKANIGVSVWATEWMSRSFSQIRKKKEQIQKNFEDAVLKVLLEIQAEMQ